MLSNCLQQLGQHGRRGSLQRRCFALTFVAYGCTFFLRRGLAVIKPDLSNDFNISLLRLGWLDMAMLLPLAIIQIFFVHIGAEAGPRHVLAYSLMLSAAALATFGWWDSYPLCLVLLFLGGSFQSLIFPNSIIALSQWYPGRGKSTIFGIWGVCVFLGSILGNAIAVQARILVGWEYVFLILSIIVGLIGLALMRLLRMPTGTTQMPLVHVGAGGGESRTSSSSTSSSSGGGGGNVNALHSGGGHTNGPEVLMRADTFSQTDRAMTVEEELAVTSAGVYVIDAMPRVRTLSATEVARISMVKEIAAAYFCVNVIRFCVYMWLPIYFEHTLGHPRGLSGYLSLLFELGGLLGSPALGLFADWVLSGRKMLACVFALSGSALCCLLFYVTSSWGLLFNAIFLILAGAGNGSTDLVLSGTVAVDLGEAEDCIGSVSGFVSGFGILGAMIQGPLVAYAVHHVGDTAVFFLLTLFAIAPILTLLRTLKLDEQGTKARATERPKSVIKEM